MTSPTEKQDDLFVDDYTVVDRSTLEGYAECPMQARLVEELGISTVGRMAETGEQIHQAIGAAVRAYLDSRGAINRNELVDELRNNLACARPDVQTDALRAFRASVYPLARFLTETIHPDNILRYDGGEGDRSGQLAWDINDLKLRVTSELDLLYAFSKEVVRDIDWKTGWKSWSLDDISESFQFQTHAVLVLTNYPDVECLQVAVWDTRRNNRTRWVEFERRDLADYTARVSAAAGEYWRWSQKPSKSVPGWPTTEKCRICPVAAHCHVADRDVKEVAENPGAVVDQLVALEARTTELKKLAWGHVQRTGEDIVSERGNAFGWNKPRKTQKPGNPVYQIKQEESDA